MIKEILTRYADEYKVRELANKVIEEPKFYVWTGSSKPYLHHFGKGGLATHTLEVIELCLQTNRYFKQCDNKLSFLAALFHDIGKLYDYDLNDKGEWIVKEHKYKIHHISKSALIFNSDNNFLSDNEKEEITHAILAHHGRKEYGSPISPRTPLAWMLHLCDNLSARMNDCDKINQMEA